MAQETRAPKFKRTQYLVSKKFQLRYVGIILLLMFLTAGVCSYLVYYTSMITLGEKLANVYPQGRLMNIVSTVNFRIIFSMILITPVVAVIGILLSHKIAGPLVRMERFLDNMAAGDLSSRIILRKGDELISLADGINRLSASLKATVTTQKTNLSKVLAEVDSLNKLVISKPQDVSGASAILNRLHKEIKELSGAFDKYEV